MKNKSLLAFSSLAALCLSAAFSAGYVTHAYLNPKPAELPVLHQAYDILVEHAFDPIPTPPALEYGMIRGMVQAYNDPQTIFVEPARHELESDNLQGSFGGIGVRLVKAEAGDLLLYPFPEGPAAIAGIADGDALRQVEDLLVTPSTPLETVQAAVRGPERKRVRLTVYRPSTDQTLEFSIRRANVPLPSVTWHQMPGAAEVGVVEINLLAASTPTEIQKAIADLQVGGVTHVILDLRDNAGGLLTAGVDTARLFLENGQVIQQQYRGQAVETLGVQRPGPLADVPIAVLVNQNTASAAEIVAGALRANGRAQLFGSHTYGKDSVQLVFELQDGSSLHVTAARWWIPGLEPPLREGGLQPDVPLAGAADNPDLQVLQTARMLIAGNP